MKWFVPGSAAKAAGSVTEHCQDQHPGQRGQHDSEVDADELPTGNSLGRTKRIVQKRMTMAAMDADFNPRTSFFRVVTRDCLPFHLAGTPARPALRSSLLWLSNLPHIFRTRCEQQWSEAMQTCPSLPSAAFCALGTWSWDLRHDNVRLQGFEI